MSDALLFLLTGRALNSFSEKNIGKGEKTVLLTMEELVLLFDIEARYLYFVTSIFRNRE